MGVFVYLIPVEGNDRKAEVLVTPHEFAMFDPKGREHLWLQVGANSWVPGVHEKWAEINVLMGAVVEFDPKHIIVICVVEVTLMTCGVN